MSQRQGARQVEDEKEAASTVVASHVARPLPGPHQVSIRLRICGTHSVSCGFKASSSALIPSPATRHRLPRGSCPSASWALVYDGGKWLTLRADP